MYGPQDGAPVPEMLWALDQIELVDNHNVNGKMIYCYELNPEDKNYYFAGEFSGGEYE
jgi:hypothetical protein